MSPCSSYTSSPRRMNPMSPCSYKNIRNQIDSLLACLHSDNLLVCMGSPNVHIVLRKDLSDMVNALDMENVSGMAIALDMA